MRSNRPNTSQTTCDAEYCSAYAITASFSQTSEQRNTRHQKTLATDGWTDVEGRDYCPDHAPEPIP